MHISTIMCKSLILLKTLLGHFWVITHRVTVKNPATFDKKLAHLHHQNGIITHNIMLSAPKNPSS